MGEWVLIAVVVLCGWIFVKTISRYSDERNGIYKTVCVDGVEYLDGGRKFSVKFNTDSTVSLCKAK
jgi:hypothetical protein